MLRKRTVFINIPASTRVRANPRFPIVYVMPLHVCHEGTKTVFNVSGQEALLIITELIRAGKEAALPPELNS